MFAGDQLTDSGGVEEDATVLILAQHLAQVAVKDGHSVTLHDVCEQCGRFRFAHRRQLSLVSDEQQTAVAPGIDVLHEVVEQASAAESGVGSTQIGHHRGLVYHKERVGKKIVVEVETAARSVEGALSVDFAVDGEGRMPIAVHRKHLGGPARRGHQHHLLPQLRERLHDGTGDRGLPRTGTSGENHERMRVAGGEKTGKRLDGLFLFGSGMETEVALNMKENLVGHHCFLS